MNLLNLFSLILLVLISYPTVNYLATKTPLHQHFVAFRKNNTNTIEGEYVFGLYMNNASRLPTSIVQIDYSPSLFGIRNWYTGAGVIIHIDKEEQVVYVLTVNHLFGMFGTWVTDEDSILVGFVAGMGATCSIYKQGGSAVDMAILKCTFSKKVNPLQLIFRRIEAAQLAEYFIEDEPFTYYHLIQKWDFEKLARKTPVYNGNEFLRIYYFPHYHLKDMELPIPDTVKSESGKSILFINATGKMTAKARGTVYHKVFCEEGWSGESVWQNGRLVGLISGFEKKIGTFGTGYNTIKLTNNWFVSDVLCDLTKRCGATNKNVVNWIDFVFDDWKKYVRQMFILIVITTRACPTETFAELSCPVTFFILPFFAFFFVITPATVSSLFSLRKYYVFIKSKFLFSKCFFFNKIYIFNKILK